jgi:uncharacterized protein (DUF1778 family)
MKIIYPRRKKYKSEPLSELVVVRLTPSQLEAATKAATEAGGTTTDFYRQAILDAINKVSK